MKRHGGAQHQVTEEHPAFYCAYKPLMTGAGFAGSIRLVISTHDAAEVALNFSSVPQISDGYLLTFARERGGCGAPVSSC